MSKHMMQPERNQICFGLDTGKNIVQIAAEIGKDRSTVSREIKNYMQIVDKGAPYRIKNRCIYRDHCSVTQLCENRQDCSRKCSTCANCNSNCPQFVEEVCPKLSLLPYVCNGCANTHSCVLKKRYYIPDIAQKEYRELLTGARERRACVNKSSQKSL